MVSAEELKKDAMWYEAVERLELMQADYQDRRIILMNRCPEAKVVVNHQEKTVQRVVITEEELRMIKKIEAEKDFIVYYLIEDEGTWPDGCTFKRYTMLYVDKYEESNEETKEDAIKRCGTCPAYVMNVDVPECSEITEFAYLNVGGFIVNAS